MRTPCEHDRLFLGKTIICGFPRVRARADWFRKSGTPPVRPHCAFFCACAPFFTLLLDDLWDSQAPAVSEAPSQYLGPQAPRIIHPKRFRSNLRKSQEVGFSVRLARARAKQCALSSTTAPPSRRANPLRHNARALRSNRQNLHELHAQKMS